MHYNVPIVLHCTIACLRKKYHNVLVKYINIKVNVYEFILKSLLITFSNYHTKNLNLPEICACTIMLLKTIHKCVNVC